MKRFLLFALALVGMFMGVNAQIGYQVTVYDQTKKAPKANQSVTATVTITDNTGTQIVSETHTGTTDDFGILSMTVGNSNSFSNANWDNLPFWVSATVDGVTISKTQMLTVPVAEYAKQSGGKLTKNNLCSRIWKCVSNYRIDAINFYSNGTGIRTVDWVNGQHYERYFTYSISGDLIFIILEEGNGDEMSANVAHYNPKTGAIFYSDIPFK